MAVVLAAALIAFVGVHRSSGQERLTRGQTVAPSFEGFEENSDGTFNMVFGYLNRNYEEILDVPIGPDNNIEPGGPDQGQPTHFLPRRRRYEFRIKVPKDFGQKELVWTLTTRGKTEKAYATLKSEYILSNRVMMMNRSSFGQHGNEGDNQPPVVKVEGDSHRSVKVGESVVLTAVVTDDGLPQPPPSSKNTGRFGRVTGLRAGWYVYRGSGNVTFEPEQVIGAYPPDWVPPALPKDGKFSVKATFSEPGSYVVRVMGDDVALQSTKDVTVTVIR